MRRTVMDGSGRPEGERKAVAHAIHHSRYYGVQPKEDEELMGRSFVMVIASLSGTGD
jgi:hypothetical protein